MTEITSFYDRSIGRSPHENTAIDFTSSANYSSIFKYSGHDESLLSNRTPSSLTEDRVSSWLSLFICFLCYLFLILTFPATGFFCVKKIPALERLVVFRLGKLQKVRGPGWAVVFPWVDRSIKVDLHPLILTLPSKQLLTSDGAIVEVSGVEILYRVCDVIKSVTRVKGLADTFLQLASQCLMNTIGAMEQVDVQGKPSTVEATVMSLLNQSTVAWGLEVTTVQMGLLVVLQEAQPRNGVSQVVSAFQSALGLNRSQPDVISTTGNGATVTDTERIHPRVEIVQSDSEHPTKTSFEIVRGVLEKAPTLHGNCTFQFQIEDEGCYLVCKSEGGSWSVSESKESDAEADVSVTLSREVLLDILAGRVTPVQAYSRSQVQVCGNWKLLVQFASVVS